MRKIKYFGSKTYMMPEIIKIVGHVINNCSCFVDVFGGSARVVISLPHEWKIKKVYNDKDKNIYRIIKFLSNIKNNDVNKFLVLHSDYFNELKDKFLQNNDSLTDFELFYLQFFSFNGKFTSISRAIRDRRFEIDWKVYKNLECENMDFIDLINFYDSEATFFYLDPPYLVEQDYKVGFKEQDFINLKEKLDNIKGFWLMNHTKDETIERIFGQPKFWKEYTNFAFKNKKNRNAVSSRIEGFWTNFPIQNRNLNDSFNHLNL